jgi:hypothetical protein
MAMFGWMTRRWPRSTRLIKRLRIVLKRHIVMPTWN